MTSIESHPEQYWAAAGRPGPVPLALGPVHPGGPTLIDLLMALFGLSTNADLGGANADIEGDDTDRGHMRPMPRASSRRTRPMRRSRCRGWARREWRRWRQASAERSAARSAASWGR